jgi:hypothetical protein
MANSKAQDTIHQDEMKKREEKKKLTMGGACGPSYASNHYHWAAHHRSQPHRRYFAYPRP